MWVSNIDKKKKKSHFVEQNRILGISGGFFGFKKSLVKHIKIIDEFYNEVGGDKLVAEQSVFNVYLFRNNLYHNSFNGLVSHNGIRQNLFDGVLIHFPGILGNSKNKYQKMKNFYNMNIDKTNTEKILIKFSKNWFVCREKTKIMSYNNYWNFFLITLGWTIL